MAAKKENILNKLATKEKPPQTPEEAEINPLDSVDPLKPPIKPKKVKRVLSSPLIEDAVEVFEIYFEMEEGTGKLLPKKFTNKDIAETEKKRKPLPPERIDHMALFLSQGFPASLIAQGFGVKPQVIHYYMRKDWFQRRVDEYTTTVGLATKAGRLREAYYQYGRIRHRLSQKDALEWLRHIKDESEDLPKLKAQETDLEKLIAMLANKPLEEVVKLLDDPTIIEGEIVDTASSGN